MGSQSGSFGTFVAVMILTNTFNIVLAVFDVSQHVIQQSAGIIPVSYTHLDVYKRQRQKIAGDTAILRSAKEILIRAGQSSPKYEGSP